jgi:integrase
MAINKKEIKNKSAKAFHNTAKPKDTLWCTEINGLYLMRYATKTSWRIKYRVHGKQHIKTIGSYPSMTVSSAVDIAKDLLTDVRKGIDAVAVSKQANVEQKRVDASTFKAYLDNHYTHYQKGKKTGTETVRMLSVEFKEWNNKPLANLKRVDANKWHVSQLAIGKTHSTVQRYWAACKGLLNKAVEDEVIESNPLKDWKLERHHSDSDNKTEKRQYLETPERDALLERLYSRPECVYSNILLVIYYTGLRPGDVLGLMWEHVNLNFKNIRKVIEKTASHKSEPTTLPINLAVVDVLKKWQILSGKKSGLVFANKDGDAIHHRTLSKAMCGYTKQLKQGDKDVEGIISGLPLPESFTPYSLRHNFASQLVMLGVDIITVSQLMCHTNIQTTITHYAHLAPDHKRAAVEVICDIKELEGSQGVEQQL